MMYDFFYQNGSDHPNCLDNINAALGTQRTIIHPVNLFMNTRISLRKSKAHMKNIFLYS